MASIGVTPNALTYRGAELPVKCYEIIAASGSPSRMAESFAPDVIVRVADFP